jgi:TolA-binding protein
MQDRKQRGSNDLEVIIHDLKKEIDRLNEEIQILNLQLKKEKEKHHQDNYDELDY